MKKIKVMSISESYYRSQMSKVKKTHHDFCPKIRFVGSESGKTKDINIHPTQLDLIEEILCMPEFEAKKRHEALTDTTAKSSIIEKELLTINNNPEHLPMMKIFDGEGVSTKYLNISVSKLFVLSKTLSNAKDSYLDTLSDNY